MNQSKDIVEHVELTTLIESERALACCTIAREKLEIGDYKGGCALLAPWWKLGEWPEQQGLDHRAAAELLLVSGSLSDAVARSSQVSGGQKWAEVLLSGSIALFDHLGDETKAVEARIELGCCYYHQGLFEVAHSTLQSCVRKLRDQACELKAVALIRLAIIERHSRRLHEAMSLLDEAADLETTFSSWTKGRFQTELANTLKDLGVLEGKQHFFDRALGHYHEAAVQFERVGNLRYTAAVENNRGYLLLSLRRFEEAAKHLERARTLYSGLGDNIGCAQVNETLGQLYLTSENYDLAESSIKLAVNTLENSGEEALLSEALTTQGIILCRLGHRHEAKPIIERARRVAERCGDREGAGRALLIMIEEMCDQLADDERREIGAQANQLLANSQLHATRERLRKCLDMIAEAHKNYEAKREQEIHGQKMAALGELSFGVAHNVNNTLTGILGRAQLILRNSNDPAKIESGLEMIIKSAEDGAHIIRRIQDFARQRPSREFEVIPIGDLLKDASEMSRPRWETRSEFAPIRFALNADCKAFVKGDPVELREVLVNMIYNAVDAMPSGGEIRVSLQESRDRVCVLITDTGTGMTPEVKQRLFDPFFTTKGKAGTGMGLAVSFGIIRRHEGSIDVESEPGRGTTFRISLPKVASVPVCNNDGAVVVAGERGSEDKVRVLVVDDESRVRDVLTEALEAEGCEVISAESGEIALALFDQNQGKIDAVFTDIGMPDMSGWELCTEIRQRSKTVPLAIISGWADAISVETRNSVQANWVIAKPFDIDKICEIAQEIAQQKTLA
ncbi:MAG TPA: ATP-binding protein [Pyrinomonadaceae bacterium]|jgi:signal transduction histidine kinase/ActR/RegA family two-component response regulator/Tfp pilus assembly protein PilF|nr:ATP-binding protein [Pyrinomonadaceae bacterium]